ncbi:MAG: ATP-dependent protease ATPase subunit HslU [Deltaproteobacteria bacterium]|jgi:ATP-dependent HslUV protease ATP-binding subunit HslU|nr:ATP-dependent protease ATPase subunit HslU [Deltaproteobacteria bacterium]
MTDKTENTSRPEKTETSLNLAAFNKERTSPSSITPKEIVAELDRYIIGQGKAKRSVSIALRNRWRRFNTPPELRDEITPKNIIMIGPTGVGKTEIARRLAKLTNSPFIKVEASKFTEVGYVGRDVETIIRDLMETAVSMVRTEARESLMSAAAEAAETAMLNLLLPGTGKPAIKLDDDPEASGTAASGTATRRRLKEMLRKGKLDEQLVDLETSGGQPQTTAKIFSNIDLEEVSRNISECLGSLIPKKPRRRRVTVAEGLKILTQEEAGKLVDMEQVVEEARSRVEAHGIVFIDEIDKVAVRSHGAGPDISREGVQKDLLPLVEGTNVSTKHGQVKTDHILFIAAGAFHIASPSDLIPEIQGRFPIRVELAALTEEDFTRILTEPHNSLTKQYKALLATEGVEIEFTPEAVKELAAMAWKVNDRKENIGARRLSTILESLLEEISFDAPDIAPTKVVITPEYVKERLTTLIEDVDLSNYIL